jgi:hypothetical protein
MYYFFLETTKFEQAASYRLQAKGFRLQASGFRLQPFRIWNKYNKGIDLLKRIIFAAETRLRGVTE